jgi:hypothetical protein
MTELIELCGMLSRDADLRVRAIGRRCLNSYDSVAGLRYASLTNGEAEYMSAAAMTARASLDVYRAELLDRAATMIRDAVRS